MINFDLYKYINSKDIAVHLKKINYQFNAFEAACIVLDTYKVPIKVRFNVLRKIIHFFPNCEGVDRRDGRVLKIHEPIKNYIRDANEFIASLMIDDVDYSYSYEYLCFKNDYDFISGNGGNYKTFEIALSEAKMDNKLQENKKDRMILYIVRKKIKRKIKFDVDEIYLTNNYKISGIKPSIKSIIKHHPFYGGNAHVPVPFERGDKIWDWHTPMSTKKLPLIYEFLEKTSDGLKVVDLFGREKIIENYLAMEFYKA